MNGVDPDDVENEVGNYWRSLYKLEKNFDSIPQAKKIAGKVRKKLYDISVDRCKYRYFDFVSLWNSSEFFSHLTLKE